MKLILTLIIVAVVQTNCQPSNERRQWRDKMMKRNEENEELASDFLDTLTGRWEVKFDNDAETYEYNIDASGMVTLQYNGETKKQQLQPSDEPTAFPPGEGWFKTSKLWYDYSWQYIRIRADGKMDIYYFATDHDNDFKGVGNYCCRATGTRKGNPCESANGGCSETCEDKGGVAVCSCSVGFILDEDQKKCIKVTTEERVEILEELAKGLTKQVQELQKFSPCDPDKVLPSTPFPMKQCYEYQNNYATFVSYGWWKTYTHYTIVYETTFTACLALCQRKAEQGVGWYGMTYTTVLRECQCQRNVEGFNHMSRKTIISYAFHRYP